VTDTGGADLARHDLIWADPEAWSEVLTSQPMVAANALTAAWVDDRRPLIVRRCVNIDATGLVRFGLPLPPAHGKLRLAGSLPRAGVQTSSSPPLLADALACVPPAWRDTVERLLDIDASVRTFGSLAWEYLTGLPYLSATSDLDLIWQLGDMATLPARLSAVAEIERAAPMRIDGEIVNSRGAAVQWRELASESSEVMAKARDQVGLLSRTSFLKGHRSC
jgi:malonate decarboxylase holo-[acyl-carrier-protein] synthase